MNPGRQLLAAAHACLRPTPLTLAGVFAYGTYLAWLAMREIEVLGSTTYILFLAVLAAAGSWIGGCVRQAAQWPGVRFIPRFVPTIATVAAVAAVSALGANCAVAWAGGLSPLPFTSLGMLVVAAGLAGGCWRPGLTKYLFLGVVILDTLAPSLDAVVPQLIRAATGTMPSVVALAAAAALVFWFARQLRFPRVVATFPSNTRRLFWDTTAIRIRSRLWELSTPQVALTSGMLAAGCTFAHRLPGLGWGDSALIVAISGVFANLSVSGTSIALPRGPLPGTARLLLSGAAKSRSLAARQTLWGLVYDSIFAAGVFAAIAIALGPDWHVVEMMLVAVAVCHAYLLVACGSRWLLSSRASVLVATPTVVAISAAAWAYGPWGLPTAFAACMLSALGVVFVGALGMDRIDLDPAHPAEPTA